MEANERARSLQIPSPQTIARSASRHQAYSVYPLQGSTHSGCAQLPEDVPMLRVPNQQFSKGKGGKGAKGRGRGRARTAFVPEPGHLGQEVCQEGTQPMPSWQTWQLQLHNRGKCFPCIAFALKPAGCFKGDECRHCHFCNGDKPKQEDDSCNKLHADRRGGWAYHSWDCDLICVMKINKVYVQGVCVKCLWKVYVHVFVYVLHIPLSPVQDGWNKQGRIRSQWTPCLTFTRATGWGRSRNWIGGGRATPALPAVKRRAAPPATTWTRAAPVLNYPSPCLRPRSRPVSNLRILRMLGVSGITLSPASHSGYDSLTNLTKTAACCWRRQRVCSDRIPSEPGLSDLIQFVCFLFKNEMSVMLNWQKANQLWDSNVGVFRGLGWRCGIHFKQVFAFTWNHGAIPLQQFGMPWASSILVMILFCFLELQSCGKNTGCLWMLGGEGFVEPQAHSRASRRGRGQDCIPRINPASHKSLAAPSSKMEIWHSLQLVCYCSSSNPAETQKCIRNVELTWEVEIDRKGNGHDCNWSDLFDVLQ